MSSVTWWVPSGTILTVAKSVVNHLWAGWVAVICSPLEISHQSKTSSGCGVARHSGTSDNSLPLECEFRETPAPLSSVFGVCRRLWRFYCRKQLELLALRRGWL